MQGALLAAGDSRTDEVQTLVGQRLLASQRVGEVSVARVDDDVVAVEQRHEFVDDSVGGVARLDHDDDRPRLAERRDEIRHRLVGYERSVATVVADEAARTFDTAVVYGDGISVAGEVSGQVPAHDRQSCHTDLGRCLPAHVHLPPARRHTVSAIAVPNVCDFATSLGRFHASRGLQCTVAPRGRLGRLRRHHVWDGRSTFS